MSRTYLHHCLKDSLLCRWPDGAMPLNVYIAPFTWYEKKKQQESFTYRQMVLESLNEWKRASHGLVRFNIVDNLNQSQLDFKWRRVDRKSLGHCVYEIDSHNRLFSAEIQIGISDGLLHSAYQDINEVRHTILHEIGHALGLIGHSDQGEDIMYVPHQYGVHTLSPRDEETISWLYRLPVGFDYMASGRKYALKPGFHLNDVIEQIHKRIQGEDASASPDEASDTPSPCADVTLAPSVPVSPTVRTTRSLDEQHHILSEMGRFYLKTQNIHINPQQQKELRRIMMEQKLQKRLPPPNP